MRYADGIRMRGIYNAHFTDRHGKSLVGSTNTVQTPSTILSISQF